MERTGSGENVQFFNPRLAQYIVQYVPPFSLHPRPSLSFRYVCVCASAPKSLPALFSRSSCKLLNKQRQRDIQADFASEALPIIYEPSVAAAGLTFLFIIALLLYYIIFCFDYCIIFVYFIIIILL